MFAGDVYETLVDLRAAFGNLRGVRIAIFGKRGLSGADTTTATAIRAIVMAIFLTGVVIVKGNFSSASEIFGDKKNFLFLVLSGIAGAC